MAKIRFYLLDITYKVKEGKPVIYMFGRTADGKQVCVIDDSFRPYFYIIPRKGEDIREKVEKVYAEKKDERYEVTGVELAKKKFLENEVNALKVFVSLPKGVPQIRDVVKDWDAVKSCHEYDILYVRRYMIDKGITPMTLVEAEGEESGERMKIPSIKAEKVEQAGEDTLKEPRVLAVDIETYNPGGRAVDTESNPILMIGLHGKNYNKVITWKTFKTAEKYIEFVKSELDLISRFKELVNEYKPDIITGYFSDGFDFPYINARAKKYKIQLDIGLDYSELRIKGRNQVQASITGIVHVDIFKFILRSFGRGGEIESLDLDTVSEALLGEKKVDVDMEELADVWDHHPEKIEEFCRYNLHDAKLAYMLCMKMLPNMIELVKIVGIPLFDIPRLGYSQLVEWFIIRQAPNFNEICMERPHYDEVRERRQKTFLGGFVYEPKPGLYNDIAVFDFRSLYPTIIASHNISPGTLNCECCVEKELAPTEEGKYWFCKKKKGFIPTIIEDLITRRMRIKEMMGKDGKKDPMLVAREQSLKLLANSFYGYLGFFNARWYSLESAKSVTAWGRFHIQRVIEKAKDEGFSVIYGDTDSVFLALDGKKTDDAVKFVEKINRKLPGVMELEFDGYYPSGLFVSAKMGDAGAKKKYALLGEGGEIEIKGFETVRRNWSFVAKDVQKDVLKIVLKDNDPKKALKYVKKMINDLRDHKVPVEKVVIHTQLQKEIGDYASVGPHVAAAKLMKNKGIDVGPGTIIKFIVAKGKGRIKDKVKLPEDAKKEDYDPEYYINNQIIPSVDRIFNALGIDSKELTEKASQSKLGSFL